MSSYDHIIGLSAGKICFSNFPHETPDLRKIIQAAEIVWEDMKSAWLFEEIFLDGTTIWLSPERDQIAHVSPDGVISIQKHE